MLTMNAVAPTRSQPSHSDELAASGTRLRPLTRWLAAAATAQRSAVAMLADPHTDPRRSVAPLLDAWTSLVLATWPDPHVPSDMRLVERAEALLLRQGETGGELARTWIELTTLLAARRGGEASRLPLGRDALAAHAARLGRLIAAPRRTVTAAPARRRLRNLGLVLLGLGALAAWLTMNPLATPLTTPAAAPAALPLVLP
jgi:hypothetical protein